MQKYKLHIFLLLAFIYLVGIVGISFPESRNLFLSMTPLSLLLSFGVILLYHRDWSARFVLFMSMIFLLSLFLEMIGVATGAIFGEYRYGKSLGPLILGTPLLIGINWAMLVYASLALFTFIRVPAWAMVGLSALILVFFDRTMEPVAHHLHMWYWPDNAIPTQNYIAWFVAAALFAWLGIALKINFKNTAARFVIGLQFCFFLLLNIIFNSISA